MKPSLAQKLYSQGKVLVENPNAEPDQALWPMARAEFLFLITALTGREAIQEALDILLKIARGELTQTIPADLEELVKELEKAEEEKEEARLEAMRKVRSFMVSYRLQKEGVTTEIPPITKLSPVPAPSAPPTPTPKPSATRTPLLSSQQTPSTQSTRFPSLPSQTLRVSLTITKPSLPIPAEIIHFVTSLPVRAIKLTLDLGREALAKADPNVQTFVLLWREGITGKAIKEALKTATTGVSQEAVEALTAQADVLEAYEKSHPFLVKLLTFYHLTREAVILVKAPEEVKKEEGKNTIDLILDTTKKTISQIRPFLPPTTLKRAISGIFNNPFTRLLASPFRAISANLLSSFKVAVIRAPIEIGRAIFPGGAPSVLPTIPTTPTTHYPLPTTSLGTPARGLGPLLGHGVGFGLRGLFGAGLRGAAGLLGAAGAAAGGIGAIGGGVAALGGGIAASAASGTGVLVLIIGGAILLPIILTIVNINNYQGAFLGIGVAAEESLYIAATKVTPETSFKNEDMPKNIPFRITVSGKKGPLKNVRITDSFTVTGKGSAIIQPYSWTVPEITNPWTQLVTVPFPDTLEDNLVINTLTVAADVEEQPTQTKTTSLALTIGTPPSACDSLSIPRTLESSELAKIKTTCTILGQSPKFTSLLKTTVSLARNHAERGDSDECGFVSGGSTINIYGCAFATQEKLTYVLTHELGHVIQNFNGGVYNEFLNQINPPTGEAYIPTYPLDFSKSEDFAENIAVYVMYNKFVFSKINRVFTEYPSSHPKHYKFAKDGIFGGVEF